MNIETSGRRQLTANQNGVLFVNRYDNFGYEADIAGNWKKPEDEQDRNRLMEPVRWIRRICFEDADLPSLVLGRWRVADEVKEGEEDPDSTKILMIRL